MRRLLLLSPYKDVIDDILAIVIIGDKDAVYDILAGIMAATRISF